MPLELPALTEMCPALQRLQASSSPAAERDRGLELLAAERQLEALEYDTELRLADHSELASLLPSQDEVACWLEEVTAMLVAEAYGLPCPGLIRVQFEA